MKKRPTPVSRSVPSTPGCDNSPPYPPQPPPTGDIPGEESLDAIFYGTNHLAKSYNDAGLVQHSLQLPDGEKLYTFSLRGGPHKRRTLSKLALTALLGPCKVVIQQGPSRVLTTGDTMDIPAGSTFSFEADSIAVLHGRSVSGPGLGNPIGGGGDDP